MLRFTTLTAGLILGMLSTAVARPQEPAQPKQQTMEQAIRFERHKVAAAKAQEAKDAQVAKKSESDATQPAPKTTEDKAKPKAKRQYSRK